jgi:glycosyltransferase involved in cell wall biosynthesis
MSQPAPTVSVVIPTYNRPELCVRAVRSAMEQTFGEIEVIVVVDGLDEATTTALAAIDDPRLRVLLPPRNLGNADARNHAIEHARADWIAFLDDDDLWMPAKLQRQMPLARATRLANPVITCRMIARAESSDFIWPRRLPRAGEPLCEYLFCRRTPFSGEGIVQTSTILTTRRLLRELPFASGMPRYVDLNWLLRAANLPGFGLEFVWDEPLAVWHMEENRARISNGADGRYTLDWAREHRHLFTPRAYGSFILWLASACAARARDPGAYWNLIREARRHGRVRPVDLLTHSANFLLPRRLLRGAASLVNRIRLQPASTGESSKGSTPSSASTPTGAGATP